MALEIALQHRLELQIAAASLDVLSQSIPNDVAHSRTFNVRDGLDPLSQTLVHRDLSVSL